MHAIVWQWTSQYIRGLDDLRTNDDVTRLAPKIVRDAMDLCQGSFALQWACAYGIGRASVAAATKVLDDNEQDHISCTGSPTVTRSVGGPGLVIAEAICSAMPDRDLGYACAEGLYVSYAATGCPPDLRITERQTTSLT